jgi:hypothetical protein
VVLRERLGGAKVTARAEPREKSRTTLKGKCFGDTLGNPWATLGKPFGDGFGIPLGLRARKAS